MKFVVVKSSDFKEENVKEIEINSIEELKELQIKMQKEHRKNCMKTEFAECSLIINFCLTEWENEEKPYIMIYDYYIE